MREREAHGGTAIVGGGSAGGDAECVLGARGAAIVNAQRLDA